MARPPYPFISHFITLMFALSLWSTDNMPTGVIPAMLGAVTSIYELPPPGTVTDAVPELNVGLLPTELHPAAPCRALPRARAGVRALVIYRDLGHLGAGSRTRHVQHVSHVGNALDLHPVDSGAALAPSCGGIVERRHSKLRDIRKMDYGIKFFSNSQGRCWRIC